MQAFIVFLSNPFEVNEKLVHFTVIVVTIAQLYPASLLQPHVCSHILCKLSVSWNNKNQKLYLLLTKSLPLKLVAKIILSCQPL